MLVLYSDGVSEAQTAVFDEFGPDRLADIVERQRERPAAAIIDAIVAAIDAFVEGAPQFDDITLMVIKRTEFVDVELQLDASVAGHAPRSDVSRATVSKVGGFRSVL